MEVSMKKIWCAFILGGAVLCSGGENGKKSAESTMLSSFISAVKDSQLFEPDPENLQKRPLMHWNCSGDYKIIYSSKKYVSIKAVETEYTGGAHGNSRTTVATFSAGKRLKIKDLYRTPLEKKHLEKLWQQAIVRHFNAKSFADHVKTRGNVFEPFMTENFYLDGKGVHFIYDPYEIDCFAAGTIDIFVPWKMPR